jgi:hypothetical protein
MSNKNWIKDWIVPGLSVTLGALISWRITDTYAKQSFSELKDTFNKYQIENIKVHNVVNQFDFIRRRDGIGGKEENDVANIYKSVVISDLIFSEYEPDIFLKALKQSGYINNESIDKKTLENWEREILFKYKKIKEEVEKRLKVIKDKKTEKKVISETDLYFKNYGKCDSDNTEYGDWYIDVDIFQGSQFSYGANNNWNLDELNYYLSNQIQRLEKRLNPNQDKDISRTVICGGGGTK